MTIQRNRELNIKAEPVADSWKRYSPWPRKTHSFYCTAMKMQFENLSAISVGWNYRGQSRESQASNVYSEDNVPVARKRQKWKRMGDVRENLAPSYSLKCTVLQPHATGLTRVRRSLTRPSVSRVALQKSATTARNAAASAMLAFPPPVPLRINPAAGPFIPDFSISAPLA